MSKYIYFCHGVLSFWELHLVNKPVLYWRSYRTV